MLVIFAFACVDTNNLDNNRLSKNNESNTVEVTDNSANDDRIQNSKEQFEPLSLEEYLVSNSLPIEIDDSRSFKHLGYIDSELEKNEIFLTGEIHNVSADTDLEMAFLKYFKEKVNFKYYLCEMPYSMSYFINLYLSTGDDAILKQAFELKYDTSTREMYQHWEDVYEYNSQLEEERRIRVIGVDIEQDIVSTYRFLTSLLPDEEVPKEIIDSIELIKETNDLLKRSFQNKYIAVENTKILLDDLKKNYALYDDFFDEDMIYYKLVLESSLTYEEAKKKKGDYVEWNNARDQGIYENFLKLDSVLPQGKYYGQWGLQHVFQSKEHGVMWFAAYLNSDESKYNGKVLSIAYNYLDCEILLEKETEATSFDAVYPFLAGVKDLYDGKFTLYKLNSYDYTRPHIQMINTLNNEPFEKDVNAFFQYILLIKNSEACQR